jgi:2-polyprenyl-6-methoxyphenol hydroxylase-like FAD-dependent oxidoreductase
MAHVLIAGGGIGGLTAALHLHRAGHEVDVFESVVAPRELGVGINLLPHSVRVLDDLGLLDELEAASVATSKLSFLSEDGVTIWSEPRGRHAGNPWPQLSIHRGRLQMILLDAARERLGVRHLHTGHRITGFTQEGESVTATFDRRDAGIDEATGSATVTADGDVLIGADGLHSTVRRHFAGDEGPPVYSGLMLWRGAVEAPAFGDGREMFMAGHDRKKAVVYPIREPMTPGGTTLINWVAEEPVEVDTATADWNAEVDVAGIAAKFTDWDWDWLNVGELIASTTVAYQFPMVDRDPLDRWTDGRVTLLGDAAHPMRPNGSNGSSQAILDGEALTNALAGHGDDHPAALAAYEAERRDPTARIVLANRQAGPERVMQWVADRCDGSCTDRHTCVSTEELEREANEYKKLAGFDLAHLRALAGG